ncbi:MAG: hypothetical protein A3F67_00390 [Verrucomicrobia bacterium RIFCSPHIGHO2_12_FULL_41_10]|nr:MAG: hypothetical protein A3F67_00390 [Verrucomicrobia bacterium RIFCSPHIGHO2_12_FULL_41_10]
MIYSAVQVAYENLDDLQVLKREQEALTEMKQHHKQVKGVLVTAKMPKKQVETCIPLWRFLLNDTANDD